MAYPAYFALRARDITGAEVAIVSAFAVLATLLQLLWVWVGRGIWSWPRIVATFFGLLLGSLGIAVLIKRG